MKKTFSLKKSFDFRKTLNYGKFSKGKYVTIYILPKRKSEDMDTNLFGICVSKKHGNSVTRNRLKRWAREAYATYEKYMKTGFLIVMLYKKDMREDYDNGKITYALIKEDMYNCIKKVELLLEGEG